VLHGAEQGVMVLLNCGDSPEMLFEQFAALDAPENRPRRKPDLRTYGVGAQILRDIGVGKMRVLGSPQKMPSMTGYELEIVGCQPMSGESNRG
jgi:3,4-dihydroxy 2-butanone 4-phosphate synthase/GTP cyclohydrolase II